MQQVRIAMVRVEEGKLFMLVRSKWIIFTPTKDEQSENVKSGQLNRQENEVSYLISPFTFKEITLPPPPHPNKIYID